MCWPAAKKFASDLLLPSSVWAEQLGRDDIPSFVSSLRAAHPDIEIGEEKELLCAETYEHEAVLRGELETQSRDLYVLVLRTDRDIVGGTIIEYDADENTVVGRMSFVSSSVRGLGLGRALLRVQKSLAIARGAQSTWGLVELDNPAQTRLIRSEGFWLCGLVPECDQRRFPDGTVQYVAEALYVMPLPGNGDIIWPDPGVLTDDVRALFSLLRLPGSPFVESGLLPRPARRKALPRLSPSVRHQLALRQEGTWPSASLLFDPSEVPSGFRIRQQARRDIPFLVNHLATWHPQLQLGSHRGFLLPEWYEQKVALHDEDQRIERKPCFSLVIEHDDQIVGLFVVSSDFPCITLTCELAVMNPRFQGRGVISALMPFALRLCEALDAETLLSFATLRHPHAQRIAQRCGLELWGVLPAAEVLANRDGRTQRGFDAVYGISLLPSKRARWPNPDMLSDDLRTLVRFVRDQRAEESLADKEEPTTDR